MIRPRRRALRLHVIIITLTSCYARKSIVNYRRKAKPGCSPPGYPPRRLLIIVDWSVNWFACVQRSTCTSCRISSHVSGKCLRGELSIPRGSTSILRCTGIANRNRSTVDLVYYTYDQCFFVKEYFPVPSSGGNQCKNRHAPIWQFG